MLQIVNQLETKKISVPLRKMAANYELYLMLLPAIIVIVIYKYFPMYGASIAFKNYSILKGINGSPWVGFQNFAAAFQSQEFFSVFMNTIIINFYQLVFQFPLPIILALMLNEVRHSLFKRVTQSITYLPHFLSWVVVSAIFFNILSPDNGVVNQVIESLGGHSIAFMANDRLFRSILVASTAWTQTGWSAIIYLAAIVSVDPQLYEAARLDGAGRFRLMWSVTLPSIRSVIIFVILLRLGNALTSDVEQILLFYSPMVYNVGDVIGTYVYRVGLTQMQFSFTAAVGLFQSVIGFILIIVANIVSRKFGNRSIW